MKIISAILASCEHVFKVHFLFYFSWTRHLTWFFSPEQLINKDCGPPHKQLLASFTAREGCNGHFIFLLLSSCELLIFLHDK